MYHKGYCPSAALMVIFAQFFLKDLLYSILQILAKSKCYVINVYFYIHIYKNSYCPNAPKWSFFSCIILQPAYDSMRIVFVGFSSSSFLFFTLGENEELFPKDLSIFRMKSMASCYVIIYLFCTCTTLQVK